MRVSVVLAAISLALVGGAHCGGVEKLPHVSITLPEGVSTDGVQVASFMLGPFGGYGGFTPKPHGRSYDIDAFVGEIAAGRVRAIVYMPGCELSRFDIPMHLENVTQQIECRKIVQVPLSGKVTLDEGLRASSLEVVVQYEAMWAYPFFGIMDGPETEFRIATVPLGDDGSFSVLVPEMNQDPAEKDANERYRGAFQLILREKKTWNTVGTLRPSECEGRFHNLALRSWYPGGVRFTLEK